MTAAEHDSIGELAASYALGALDDDDRRRFEAHLRSCAECVREVRDLGRVVDGLALTAPAAQPSTALRARILTQLPRTETTNTQPWGWLAAAAMLIVSVALGAFNAALRDRIRVLEQQVADAMRTTEVARVRLAVVTAPDLVHVKLAGQAPAPAAAARAFWSRSRGLVFAAASLPSLPAGRTYQLWYLTPGAPVSAGLVQPDAEGRAFGFFPTPANVAPTGFAVSLEPEGGVPAPTGAIYLAGSAP